jgi:hypothetical protein
VKPQGKKQPPLVQFNLAFVGTAWCISRDRFLVTAHHILNGGKPRNPDDIFYAFAVPGNGLAAYAFPITDFPVEDPTNDLAILEVGPPAEAGQHIPSVPVTFDRPPDGFPVLTYGFPAPAIAAATVSSEGKYLGGGQFFLKGHANEGIVSAQYDMGGVWHFEFNVGWHHGESGGPVFRQEPLAAFAVMQHYRNIETPIGTVAGPHCGRALAVIRDPLIACGAETL